MRAPAQRRRALPRRRLALGLALLAPALAGALAAAPAQARWGPGAELASADFGRLEQGDGATTAVDVSADGRYVVFQTRASNFFADDDPDSPGRLRQGGIFRFDRAARALELVADGDELDELTGDVVQRGAFAPSVSDDGRWVAFASAQRLVPQDVNDNVDVYVRDLAQPLGPGGAATRAASGAYTLVSARDGGDVPAGYAPRDPPLPGRTPGSAVYAGQAISGDGRYVAFRTVEQASDLPDRATADTPPGNVFVRDLHERRTVLVSRQLADGGPAGGALAPVVLSRDGTTVSWVGENGPLQTRMLGGESGDEGQRYYLWRRWADAGAATRRITGLADPDDPDCPLEGQVANNPRTTGPCYGPLADVDAGFNDIGGRAPSLSGDGWTVAYLSGAAARPADDVDPYLDAYVTSMRPGVSRKAGTRVVTKGTTAPNARANGEIESVTLSADGSRLLLVTTRRQFLPPAPPLIGEARTSQGASELYAVDLGANQLRRVLLSSAGADVNGTVDPGPALSADGRVAAFTSSATNLFRGDANEQPDAFAVLDTSDAAGGPPPSGLGGELLNEDVASIGDDFAVRVRARRDGTLLLRVTVPRSGALEAVARTRPAVRRAKGGRANGGRAKGRGVASARKPRRVARARTRARRQGLVRMTLRLKGRDRVAVRRGTPLRVRVALTLAPSDGTRVRRASAPATFRAVARPARKAKRQGRA